MVHYFIYWVTSNKTQMLESYLTIYSELLAKMNQLMISFEIIQNNNINNIKLSELIPTKTVDKIFCVSSNMMFKKSFRLDSFETNQFLDMKLYCLPTFNTNQNTNKTLGEYFHKNGTVISTNGSFVYDVGFASNNDMFNKEYVFDFPLFIYRFYDPSMNSFLTKIINNEPLTNWKDMPFYVMKTLNTFMNDYQPKTLIYVNSSNKINIHSKPYSNTTYIYLWETYFEYEMLHRQIQNKLKYWKMKTGIKLLHKNTHFNWYKLFSSMFPKTLISIYDDDVLQYTNTVDRIMNLPISFFYTYQNGSITHVSDLSWTKRKVFYEYNQIKPFYENINRLFYGKRVDEALGECLMLINNKCKYKPVLIKKIIGCSIIMKTPTQQLTKLLNTLTVEDEELIVQLGTLGEMLKSAEIVNMFFVRFLNYIETHVYNPNNLLKMMQKMSHFRMLNNAQIMQLWQHYTRCVQFDQTTNIESNIKKFLDFMLASDVKELSVVIDEFMQNVLKINMNDFEAVQSKFPLFTYHKLVKIDPYPTSKTYFDDSRKQIRVNLDLMLAKYNHTIPLNEIIYYTPSNFYYSYHGKSSKDIFMKQCQLLRKLCPELNYKYVFQEGVNKKIKVGFISNCLNRWHSVFKDRHQVIKHLSENPKFEVYVFYFNDISVEVLDVYSKCHLVKCKHDIENVRNTVIKYNLNILVYPEIGMDKVCYFAAFMKLAKTQINTWGHSDTSGIDTIDYYVSSKLFELPLNESQEHYSEKLVLLDSLSTCYVNPVRRYAKSLMEFSKQMQPRVNLGFSNYNHIYFCLQSLFKINPIYDSYLCDILEKDEKAILILIENDKKHKLIERLEPVLKHNMSKIHWLKGCEHKQYLNYMFISDVVLDTYPFGGCNSSFEAFSLCKPVITQPSQMINGRFTYGFYQRMGIKELICNNQMEYVNAAIMVATNRTFKTHIIQKLRENNEKLFNDQESLNEWTSLMESLK
jgi:predicted O-linked N-acetylglucosamine transferase (SPINDLY family)